MKVNPLQINDSGQGILLQLSCLVGSNVSLVSTLNFVKSRKLRMGLSCILGAKLRNFEKEIYKAFPVSFWSPTKCFSLEISCHKKAIQSFLYF